MTQAAHQYSDMKVPLTNEQILTDYRVGFLSRQASLIGRREVLSGKAKFGIFGDGKEVAQIAMARAFQKGDWRSGYYRDQTFMFAVGASDVQKFFAQLYADTDPENEPASSGRQMNSHYSTRFLSKDGHWMNQLLMHNSSSDMSPTAGQMARSLGLAYASKLYRQLPHMESFAQFSASGNEVSFVTIGDASTSEGVFWEVLNAAGVLQVPLALFVWDDGYGISVPKKYQTTKESISAVCAGFEKKVDDPNGYEIYRVKGWDYPALLNTFQNGVKNSRTAHTPVMFHVEELTQPQGHSTSGSHERYKDEERLRYENDKDCLAIMRQWILGEGIASEAAVAKLEEETVAEVKQARERAWENLMQPIESERTNVIKIYEQLASESAQPEVLQDAAKNLERQPTLQRRAIAASLKRTLIKLRDEHLPAKTQLQKFSKDYEAANRKRYHSFLYPEGPRSHSKVEPVPADYAAKNDRLDGRQVIQRCMDHHLKENERLFIIGEDVGHLGGVNSEFEGLQEKHGELRISDTGIREASILGQGIGAALRGLRPIVDIQYLDYVLYCLQVMSDDLASTHYRSAGNQIAPVIVRTKGHRLEGIWHTGSPMGTLVNSIRGMHLCVPRNMVQAAGMYNTLLACDDPALVIEVLNGYRLKEAVPANLETFRVELGVPEVLKEGSDITLVTYGACVRIAEDAIALLASVNISVELIDIQTLLPFDKRGIIADSISKTHAVLFIDEDVSGGASAYMMQQTLDRNGAFDSLDSFPRCISACDHRGAYASDGDYYSKPNAEEVFEAAYEIMRERDPALFPAILD